MASPNDSTHARGGPGAASDPSVARALGALALSTLLASLGTSIANVGLPTFALVFDASFQAVQWIVLAYLLASTTLIVGVGRLGDIVGRRRLLVGGITLFTASSLLCGLAPALAVLVVARAAQGLGAAVMMALTLAFVSETVPKARSGQAMGLLGSASAIGTALGPSLGGALLAGPGWRALFLMNVPLGIIALLLARRHLPADRPRTANVQPAFDSFGTLLLGVTLGAYSLAMTVGRRDWGTANLALLVGAAVGARLFVRAQARASSPLVRLSILSDRALAAGLITNALVSTVMMATLVVGPFYLARALGLRSALVGLAMSVGPVVAALSGVPAGRLADRVGTRRTTIVGLGAMTIGTLLLAVLPRTLAIAEYVGPIAVVTLGYALFQTANNAAVMTGVLAEERGVIAGLLSLSRNLGLVTGASVLGAVFAFASGPLDVAMAPPEAVAVGMRVTLAVAALLSGAALALATVRHAGRRFIAVTGAALVLVTPLRAQSALPRDPYPVAAAGWGPSVGQGRHMSRWAEDWTTARSAGVAPRLKSMPLGGDSWLTLSGEARVRQDAFTNARLTAGDSYGQALLRLTAGADARLSRHLRVYGEVASGEVAGRRDVAGPNFRNSGSLQELFLDARGYLGSMLLGSMAGRQEFADGPRQLVSVSDGPNVHRTWNGVRLYAHGPRARIGAFDLRATRQGTGLFDETVDRRERLRGVNGSVLISRGAGEANVYLDPFWLHTAQPEFRAGGRAGSDERNTVGARLWGRRGPVGLDWTLARQQGHFADSLARSWALFMMQNVTLSNRGWRPRLDLRLDVASGGDGHRGGPVAQFNPLYASSAYLGEGQFLGLANLAMLSPGLTLAPSAGAALSFEAGLARRFACDDPVRAGGMRAYETTRATAGCGIGRLLRVAGTRTVDGHLTLFLTHERLVAGDALDHANLPGGSYSHIGMTLRY